MNISRYSLLVVAIVATADPAAAQAPRWFHELADDVAVEATAQARAIARVVETRMARARVARQRGQAAGSGPEHTEVVERTMRVGDGGALDLRNVHGDIVIEGVGGDEIRLRATKRVRHRDDAEAARLLESTTVTIVERNTRVDVRVESARRRDLPVRVDFSVQVPRGISVTLGSVSGGMQVSGVEGELRSETVSGDIAIAAARRVREAKTVSGDVDISDAAADDLSATSVSGDVTLRAVDAGELSIQTVSGDVRLSGVATTRTSVRSVAGDVDFAGPLAANGRYELQSHSGDIRVTPADDRGFLLEASTFSGEVRSALPLTLDGVPGGRRGRSTAIRGSFGDADARLSAQSFSGDVEIAEP